MKGKSEFTIKEINEIKELIVKKLASSSSKQVSVRNKIRKCYQFYWTDYYTRDVPYNVENFDLLIKNGSIKVID